MSYMVILTHKKTKILFLLCVLKRGTPKLREWITNLRSKQITACKCLGCPSGCCFLGSSPSHDALVKIVDLRWPVVAYIVSLCSVTSGVSTTDKCCVRPHHLCIVSYRSSWCLTNTYRGGISISHASLLNKDAYSGCYEVAWATSFPPTSI